MKTERQISSGGVIFRTVNSKIEVALIAVKDGKVWGLPKGLRENGEGIARTAHREVKEETGVDVRIDRLLGVFCQPGNPVIFIAFAATVLGGEPVCGDECMAVDFFPPERMPELAFPHDGEILRRWASESQP